MSHSHDTGPSAAPSRSVAAWPIVVLLVGLAATLAIGRTIERSERAVGEEHCRVAGRERSLAIEKRFATNFEIVRSLAAFFIAAGSVDREQFATFTGRQVARHPELQALEWIPYVRAAERDRHERATVASGVADYRIRERAVDGSLVEASPRADYFPVHFVEPLHGNRRAVGFDLGSEPVRRAALEKARDTGRIAISERIELVQARQHALLVFAPVFRDAIAPDTVEARRQAIVGYALGVFAVEALVAESLADLAPGGMDMLLLDDAAAPERRIVHLHPSRSRYLSVDAASLAATLAEEPPGSVVSRFRIGDRSLRLVAAPTEAHRAAEASRAPTIALAVGAFVSLLLSALTHQLRRESRRIEQRVDERTAELNQANATLAREIVERERVQAELLDAKREAESANRAKSEFLATMSHEIRTPMNGVMGMAGLLADSELGLEQQEMVKAIRRSADSLLTIINEILDFSKIEAGSLVLEVVAFDPRVVLEEVVDLLRSGAEEKGLAIRWRSEGDVAGPWLSDPARIRQVVTNLVGNAIKFTKQGGVTLHVAVECHDEDAQLLRFRVEDTGIGIPPEQVDRVFDRFTQADASTTRRFGGTGLGLTISREIVHALGGEMTVSSEPGQGSRFEFTVPVERSGAPAADPVDARPETPSEPSGLAGLRVLLAEDNLVNQKVATKMLERMGCHVDVVANGAEAVAAVATIPYHLVLMDCQMPDMDGFEATAAIRRRGGDQCDIPIIAVTANAMEGDEARCLEAGMDDYVAKPIRAEVLTETMLRYVRRR